MAMFENISYQGIHRTIIFQMVYIRMQDFEVIFMYLSLMLQKCSQTLSTTFLKSHPFLMVSDVYGLMSTYNLGVGSPSVRARRILPFRV